MQKVERDAIESCVVGVIERAISSMMTIGCSNQAALSLLMNQSAIRIQLSYGTAEVRKLLRSIEGQLVDDDDDDDDHCALGRSI